MNPTALVRLRNGTDAPAAAVASTMIALRDLADSNPIVLWELRETCTDRDRVWFPGATEAATALGLATLRGDGTAEIHPIVRDVVQSAVLGEGAEMDLHSPYAD